MKINLGSGYKKLKGYINCDVRESIFPDMVFDITKGLPFKDNEAEKIKAISVLEHVSKWDKDKVFKECYRVLKKGGKLIISIPNMGEMAKMLFKGSKRLHDEQIINFIYGENDYPENTHRWGWNEKTIKKDLEKAGFKEFKIFGKYNKRYKGEMLIKTIK